MPHNKHIEAKPLSQHLTAAPISIIAEDAEGYAMFGMRWLALKDRDLANLYFNVVNLEQLKPGQAIKLFVAGDNLKAEIVQASFPDAKSTDVYAEGSSFYLSKCQAVGYGSVNALEGEMQCIVKYDLEPSGSYLMLRYKAEGKLEVGYSADPEMYCINPASEGKA